MTPEKTALLEQINATIKKKWFKNSSGIFAYPHTLGALNTKETISENSYFADARLLKSVKNLESRIESLESSNEHLFNFINFLIENLPDLVINVIQSEWENLNSINYGLEDPEVNTSSQSSPCTSKKKFPCPTKREKDILDLLVKGFCAKEIANKLFISETTVITHKKNLKEKFNAKNTVELISKACTRLIKTNK